MSVSVAGCFPAVMNSRKAQGAALSTSRDARLTVWSGSIDCIVIQHFVEVYHYQYVIPLPRYHWSLDTGLVNEWVYVCVCVCACELVCMSGCMCVCACVREGVSDMAQLSLSRHSFC